MRTIVICLATMVVASSSGSFEYSQAFSTDIIANTTRMELPEWNATRGCEITPDAEKVLLGQMEEIADTIRAKQVKYHLSSFQQKTVIKGIAYAYLDEVSVKEFGALRRNCRLNAARLVNHRLPPVAKNPDAGYLDVNGSTQGAEIYIDGEKKGYIRQKFILSVGSHLWKTMKCEERIEITPNETKTVYCRIR